MMVDSLDATHKTVWVAGVDGGLWMTTDITASPATWTLVNDFLSNLAVSDICQDPTNGNIMYFCTGESYYNADAVSGVGVFKSINHGTTWSFLSSTSAFIQGKQGMVGISIFMGGDSMPGTMKVQSEGSA